MKHYSPLLGVLLLSGCQMLSTPQPAPDVSSAPQVVTSAEKKVKRVTDVDKAMTVSPAVSELLKRAEKQQQSGDLMAATATIERAIRLSPRYPDSYYQLASIHQQQGHAQQASTLAKKAISLGAKGKVLRQSQALLTP